MIAVLAIARSTITELRRQRLLIIPAIAVVLSLLTLVGGLITADQPVELERDAAEAAAWGVGVGAAFGGGLYALVVGASLIARELSEGSMLMLAARPIGRWQIVVGRLAGAAAFIVATLLATAVVYGVVAAIFSGSLAPLDDPMRAVLIGLPGVLLALCVGAAFSIRGKATAAIGSAVAFSVFATSLTLYVSSWRNEQHLRSYLQPEIRAQLPANDPVVGPTASLVVRVLPYGVFMAHAANVFADDYDDPEDLAPRADPDRRITTGTYGYAYPPGTSPPALPADPDPQALEYARTSGNSSGLLRFRNAWTRAELPPYPRLDEPVDLLLAWFAIPLWIGISILLLTRRRDLV